MSTFRMKVIAGIGAAAATLSLTACGGGDTGHNTAPSGPDTSVSNSSSPSSGSENSGVGGGPVQCDKYSRDYLSVQPGSPVLSEHLIRQTFEEIQTSCEGTIYYSAGSSLIYLEHVCAPSYDGVQQQLLLSDIDNTFQLSGRGTISGVVCDNGRTYLRE